MRTKTPSVPFGRPAKKAAGSHHKGIHPHLFYGLFAALVGTNIVTAVGFLMSPDVAGLVSGQTDVVLSAYEDRIAELRVEVDRLHSRQYAQAGDINLQLQELAQQQEVLTEQQQFVHLLAAKAAELGIDANALPPAAAGDDDDQASLIEPAAPVTVTPAATPAPAQEIAQAGEQMKQMMNETRVALAAINDAATDSTDEILSALKGVGIKPQMPATEGVGGPFLPPEDGPDSSSLVDDANDVMDALSRFKAAKDAIELAPIHKPMVGSLRISSGFGNRRDPFTGGKAFHAGIDFPAPRGTSVLAAGEGTVTFVGQMSGYGNVVEVTHGAGIVTRYGHLSEFLVKEGQKVRTGTPIAKVGSTGRSTGPHLHFEVRRDDTPIDPGRYLAVGTRLARFLA